MHRLFIRLWHDDGGALLSIEWVFLATILVIGVTTGLVTVRNAVNSELTETANAFMALDQSYSFSGQTNLCSGFTAGSAASDVPDRVSLANTQAAVPSTPINTPPCTEEALPAAFSGAATRPGTISTGTGVTPTATSTATPIGYSSTREPCTDVSPGGRDSEVRPIRTPERLKPDDSTDQQPAKNRDNNVSPSSTNGKSVSRR